MGHNLGEVGAENEAAVSLSNGNSSRSRRSRIVEELIGG